MSNTIKNIIFDFGGVVLNIDYKATAKAFAQLGVEAFANQYSQYLQSDLFIDLERGNISPENFFETFRNLTHNKLSQQEITEAWNAMLLDFPTNRIDLLMQIKPKYRTFLLSNSNIIHYDSYLQDLKEKFNLSSFNELFEKAYFSFELGINKPNKEIFLHVLSQNHLDAKETLFIDDSLQHVEAAKACGINTYWLKTGDDIVNLFDKEGNLLL